MALMTLMDKLITALENGEHVIGIFLDFSNAFDTVDHEILLKKRCTIMVSEEQHTNGFRVTYQTENSMLPIMEYALLQRMSNVGYP